MFMSRISSIVTWAIHWIAQVVFVKSGVAGKAWISQDCNFVSRVTFRDVDYIDVMYSLTTYTSTAHT